MVFGDVMALSAGSWFGKNFQGARVPSFDDGLMALGDKMGAYFDAKDITPQALIAAIHEYHLEDRHVVYQSLRYCEEIQKLDSGVRTLPPLRRLDQLDAVAAIKPYGVDASWSILSKEVIDRCHKLRIQVFSDALGVSETTDQYQKAIDWRIDCIQTDHPARVLRAIELMQATRFK
jgi:glycerophosphoryl diester phosphodiesterase